MMVLRSSPWSLPWEKVLLMMLLTPFGVDLWNTLLYHLEALQLSFSPFFLCSFPTLSEGYNTTFTQHLTYCRRAMLLAGLDASGDWTSHQKAAHASNERSQTHALDAGEESALR